MTDPALTASLPPLAHWLWMLGITALLWVALHLSRIACRRDRQGDSGWSGAAALAGVLTGAAFLIALNQPHAWGIGQVLLTVMVALAQRASEQPTALWSSR